MSRRKRHLSAKPGRGVSRVTGISGRKHGCSSPSAKMFQLIWQIYTTGIVIFFLVFLLLEEQPFGPALMNAIFWPAGVYNIYIAGG